MSDVSPAGRFPDALRSAAAARWSHRDPVESGNPFPPHDSRYEIWNAATLVARGALVQIDRDLDEFERAGPHPDPYPVRVVRLAEARFDVWAKRLLAVVCDAAALKDYEEWLTRYVGHWLVYVSDTCPRIDVGAELRTRLAARADHWVEEASRVVHPPGDARHAPRTRASRERSANT